MQRCLMFTSKAMGQGGAPCALQIGHDRGQWRCMKQSKGISILVAIPFPGLTLTLLLSSPLRNLMGPIYTRAGWKRQQVRHQLRHIEDTHVLSPPQPSCSGMLPPKRSLHFFCFLFFFFCCWGFYMPNQTTKEWYFPLVQVLGKNYMSLFKNYPSQSPKVLTFTLNPLGTT